MCRRSPGPCLGEFLTFKGQGEEAGQAGYGEGVADRPVTEAGDKPAGPFFPEEQSLPLASARRPLGL